MFHVGQKVVCVYAGGLLPSVGQIVEGGVYTISRVNPPNYSERGHNRPGVELAGIKRRCSRYFDWDSARFRPLVERKTDISIFTAMLNPSKRRVRA